MATFDDILEIKKRAQASLLALPGVHAVALGTKIRGGRPTGESAIVVFTTRKRDVGELRPEEMIPAEIDGVPTDVVEREMPKLIAGPAEDSAQYKTLTGGIQIQGGTALCGTGTMGCIAKTKEATPRVVGVTCHHVFEIWPGVAEGFNVTINPQNKNQFSLWGTNLTGSRVTCAVTLKPVAPGPDVFVSAAPVVTTAADTPVTVAARLATAIGTAGAGKLMATATSTAYNNAPGGTVTITPTNTYTASLDAGVDAMWATYANGFTQLTLVGGVKAALIVEASMLIVPTGGKAAHLRIFYVAVEGDTLHSVASHLADRINAAGNPGVIATGPATATGTEVTIASGPGAVATIIGASAYPPYQTDPGADLKAASTDTTIAFSGSVDENYGVYVMLEPVQDAPSSGIFFQPAKGADLSTVASGVTAAISAQHVPGVTATAAGAQINLAGTELIRCQITSDARVGQPTNDFASSCSKCCDKRVGIIADAQYQVDAAIFQLDADLKYVAEVQDIGPIAGDHTIADAEAATPDSYVVKKRGRTTLLTTGKVNYLHAGGVIGSPPRNYSDAIVVDGDNGSTFADHGDSGSALLNAANQVVGIVFGAGGSSAWATPIAAVEAAFNIALETATAANDVRTVPAAAAHMVDAAGQLAPATIPAMRAERLNVHFERLREAEHELAATPLGGELATTLRRHIPETQRLIGTNPRFAGMWQSYGGPEIVQSILRMPHVQNQTLPATINGRPLRECLDDIRRLLRRYASEELNRDLQRFEGLLERLLHLNYSDLLLTLRTSAVE